jgi:hypothetical protein
VQDVSRIKIFFHMVYLHFKPFGYLLHRKYTFLTGLLNSSFHLNMYGSKHLIESKNILKYCKVLKIVVIIIIYYDGIFFFVHFRMNSLINKMDDI